MRRLAERGARIVAAVATVRRIRTYSLLALVANVLTQAASIARGSLPFDGFGHPIAVDLSAYLVGTRLLLAGNLPQLYDPGVQWMTQQELLGPGHPEFLDLFVSPPFVTFLYAPLAALSYTAAALVWTMVSLILLAASIALLWPLLPRLHPFGFATVLLVVASWWPTAELFLDGQETALILLAYAGGLRLLLARRDVAAGAVLSISLVKPQLVLLVPLFLLIERRGRALATFSAVGMVLVAVSVVLVSPAGARDYVALLSSDLVRHGSIGFWWKASSLTSLFELVSPPAATSVLYAATLAAGALVYRFVTGDRAASCPDDLTLRYAGLILVTSVVAPHFLIYDEVLVVLPGLILFDRDPRSASVVVAVVAAWTIGIATPLRGLAGTLAFPLDLIAVPLLPGPVLWMIQVVGRSQRARPRQSGSF